MRYYKQALQWAGYPNVLETIGSCMVCTASVYALEGGMNKRKAGEDFYFINKLAKNNKSKTIYEATVFPSSRTSDRVPFGTGKAMEVYTQNTENEYFTYAFDCFIALQNFLNQLPLLYTNGFEYIIIDTHTKAFLEREKIEENVAKMHQQSKDFERFKLRFFYWFDGLKALQLIHYLTEKKYAKVTVTKASLVFLEKINHLASFNNTLTILNYYRSLEKNEYICQ